VSNDGADVRMSDGRLFHARGPATANARSPIVERRVEGTTRSADDTERRRRRAVLVTGTARSVNDCMRNAKKSPKIPYSATVREWKSNPESTSRFRSTPKFNHFYRVIDCPCLPCLIDIRKRVHKLSCLQNDNETDRQTDRQTNRQTERLNEWLADK